MKTQKIKRVVVGLSNTYLDAEVIHYMNFIAHTTHVEHIFFVHIIDVRLPANILKQFPDLEKAALEERRKEIEAVVDKHIDKDLVTAEYSVEIEQSSNSLKGLSRVVGKFDADLIVIGRVANKEKTSIITQRLARRAPCQLLIVPEGQADRIAEGKKLSTLLVPIDFSDYSSLALDRAIKFARRNKDLHEVEIVCQYVFQLPSGYHLSGKTEEEFAEIMCANAKEDYEEFVRDFDLTDINIRMVYSRDVNGDLTSDIRDLAEEIDADLVIIGSKGRTSTAALFLGSFAEKLITNNTHFSLMVVRKKKEYDGILDRIKKL
jgi:nucleotide-binding universal stress UspA family protein